MSGLGGSSSYACKAPDGVSCESISGTWANAVAGNLPAQREKTTAPVQAENSVIPGSAPSPVVSGAQGFALRSQAHTLRLWMKPWVDIDGDLYGHAYLYVQINDGKWLVDRIERPVRDAHAPLRAPASSLPEDRVPSGGASGESK